MELRLKALEVSFRHSTMLFVWLHGQKNVVTTILLPVHVHVVLGAFRKHLIFFPFLFVPIIPYFLHSGVSRGIVTTPQCWAFKMWRERWNS